MKRISLLGSFITVLMLLIAPAAVADNMSGMHILYTPTVDLSTMSQNTTVGEIGGVFLTSGTTWPYANWLGYADPTGHGLSTSHVISLYYTGGNGGSTVSKVAEATVPAGTVAPLYDGYRWVQLASRVGLWYGSWYTISAQTDGTDLWGDLISNGTSTQINWDNGAANAYANSYVGNQGGWSRAGRYGASAPPGTQVSTTDSIYPIANLAYGLEAVVPEPASFGLLALGAVMLFGLRRKH